MQSAAAPVFRWSRVSDTAGFLAQGLQCLHRPELCQAMDIARWITQSPREKVIQPAHIVVETFAAVVLQAVTTFDAAAPKVVPTFVLRAAQDLLVLLCMHGMKDYDDALARGLTEKLKARILLAHIGLGPCTPDFWSKIGKAKAELTHPGVIWPRPKKGRSRQGKSRRSDSEFSEYYTSDMMTGCDVGIPFAFCGAGDNNFAWVTTRTNADSAPPGLNERLT